MNFAVRSLYSVFLFILICVSIAEGVSEEKNGAQHLKTGEENGEAAVAKRSLSSMRIGLIPFAHGEKVAASEAGMIGQVILTHLSERRAFQLIEVRGEELREETALKLSGYVDSREAIELGGKLELKFLLTGYCTAGDEDSKQSIRVSIRLTEAEAGRVIYGKTEEISSAHKERELRSYVGELAHDLERLVLGQSLDEIETLMRLRMWDRAYAAIKEYTELSGINSKVKRLRKRLFENLENQTLERITTAQEYDAPEEAIALVPLLLSYSDNRGPLEEKLKGIYTRHDKNREALWQKDRERIEEALDKGNIEYAREILNDARQVLPPSTDLEKFVRRIDKKESQLYARRAKFFSAAGDYSQASFYIKKALSLETENSEYVQILKEIEKKRARRQEHQRTVGVKKARWANSRRKSRFLDSSLSMNFFSDTLQQLYIDGAFPRFEGRYTDYAVLLPPFYRGFGGGGTVSWGEDTSTGGGNDISTEFTHFDLFAAASAALRFTRFEFALEGRAGIGALFRTLSFDIDPSLDNEKINLTLGFGVRADARYAWGEHLLSGIGISWGPLYVAGEGTLDSLSVSAYAGWAF